MKAGPGILILSAMILFSACQKTELEKGPEAAILSFPDYFPAPDLSAGNPLTKEGIALGRMLFFDKRLSASNQISCATCHQPDLAFTDGVSFSRAGESGNALHRHTPALINLAWVHKGLFWDGGSTNLESQAFGPLTHPDEMRQDLFELVAELRADRNYPSLFRKVFGDTTLKTGYIVQALAQFQRTLISAGSKYDQVKQQKAVFSASEEKGFRIVQEKCGGCHPSPLFTDNDFHNNGIDADFSNTAFEGIYQGRYRISYDPQDLGKFRTPTLRNIMITAPYMHDGRFADIDEVLDHYSSGIHVSSTLDSKIPLSGFQLSPEDKTAVVHFLKCLNDPAFIQNPEFRQ